MYNVIMRYKDGRTKSQLVTRTFESENAFKKSFGTRLSKTFDVVEQGVTLSHAQYVCECSSTNQPIPAE